MSAQASAVVISVAAPPGGGKTTLSTAISAKLGNVPVLHFDDYQTFTERSTAEIEAWVERGARFEEITAPGFAEELGRLRASGASYLVVDAPVGRAHPATSATIDYLIFVDTPLDLALARVVRAQATRAARASDAAAARNFAIWLESYLDNYPRFMRRIYDAQRASLLPNADLVLDGSLAPERLADMALAAIAQRVKR